MCRVILCNDKAAARLLVETMNDAGALFPADSRQRGAVVEERVNQSVLAMTSARVNNKPRWLVDNDQIVVFKENLKWDLLWKGLNFFQWRLGELNLIAGPDEIARARACAIERDEFI